MKSVYTFKIIIVIIRFTHTHTIFTYKYLTNNTHSMPVVGCQSKLRAWQDVLHDSVEPHRLSLRRHCVRQQGVDVGTATVVRILRGGATYLGHR